MKAPKARRARLGLRVGLLFAALSLAGVSSPASADEVADLIARLEQAAEISSALAVSQGGYSLVGEQLWDDGAFEREISNFAVDNSYSFFRETRLPNGKVTKSGFINDRRAKTQSWLPGSDKETRQALQLLQADPDSWIVKSAPRALNVDTIRSQPAGWLLSYYLPPPTKWAYEVMSDDLMGDIVYSLRGNAPETEGYGFEVSVTLGSDGAVSAMRVTDVTIEATKNFTWAYVAPVIEQPTGRAVIRNSDFERAKQAPKLLDSIQYFAFHAGVNMKSPSPTKLFDQARHGVANWRGDKLSIPIRVSKIKWGARLAAVNPFTKERHVCELVVDFPGSNGKPEIYCKSGGESWKPFSMCTQTVAVAGCIVSGPQRSGEPHPERRRTLAPGTVQD